jgi:glutathione peroxidase
MSLGSILPKTSSIYDIPLKSWDNKENFLNNYKGKVTLIVNVTANCGNAPQLKILDEIHKKYKDRGFAVVAIPTNDYCGPGITYGKWVNGIESADDARSYSLDTYQTTFDFSEMISSKPNKHWRERRSNNEPPHPLFSALNPDEGQVMGGNFEKYLVDRQGNLVTHFRNDLLLDDHVESIKLGFFTLKEGQPEPIGGEEAFDFICSEIEKIL